MIVVILGRQPAISIAEIESVFGGNKINVVSDYAATVDALNFTIEKFGSIPKAGIFVTELSNSRWHDVSQYIVQKYLTKWSSFGGKITLGISTFGFNINERDVQKTGIILKQKLKKFNVNLRLIPNSEPALNTATSHHNKLGLADNKVELLVIRTNNGHTILAESTGSQNITAYAKRDQQRPKRDAFVGMLPPKLAQIMINLAVGQANNDNCATISPERLHAGSDKGPDALSNSGCRCSDKTVAQLSISQPSRSVIVSNVTLEPESELAPGLLSDLDRSRITEVNAPKGEHGKQVILDPFCGTGVILQEAALIGYRVYGSDLSEKMIDYSRVNLNWLAETHGIDINKKLHIGDAINTKWEPPIDAVVSETYLGQPFSAPPSPAKLEEVKNNCNHIISEFLINLRPQIKSGTPVCLAVPAWRGSDGSFSHLPLVSTMARLGYKPHEFHNISQRDMLYFREDQIVARELLVLIRQ